MDIVDLREFYESRLGHTTRRLIANRLKPRLGSLRGTNVMGLGFAAPYLEECAAEAERAMAFMLARHGVIHWPTEGPVRSALVDELDLPLLESTINLALVVHGLEFSDSPEEMLREIWRVLSPQGRMLLVVPNRRGLWASFDSSPFGYGQPFSKPQLSGLLRESQFSVVSWSQALFMPPSNRGLVISSAAGFEAIGRRITPAVGGAIIVEAVKQVYAVSTGKRVRRLATRLRPVLAPAPAGLGRQTVEESFAFGAGPPKKGAAAGHGGGDG